MHKDFNIGLNVDLMKKAQSYADKAVPNASRPRLRHCRKAKSSFRVQPLGKKIKRKRKPLLLNMSFYIVVETMEFLDHNPLKWHLLHQVPIAKFSGKALG